jgi:PIN domain nuclease of toxin-antitoxin system
MSPNRLQPEIRTKIVNAEELLVSSISRAEIGIKLSIGKLRLPVSEAVFWSDLVSRLQASSLPFDDAHAAHLASLPLHHRDPFDRMIVAQCLADQLTLATTDSLLAVYNIPIVC